MPAKNRGFSLIELIVVIVIVAILAAVAMPRLTRLDTDARIAKLNTARGSVAGAATLVHSLVFTRGGVPDTTPCPAGGGVANNSHGSAGTICTEVGIVNIVNAYPDVTALGVPGLLTMAGLTTDINPSRDQLQAEGYDYQESATVATFQVLGGDDAANCSFSYTEAGFKSAPIISSVNTTGC